jgi:peptide deformylase
VLCPLTGSSPGAAPPGGRSLSDDAEGCLSVPGPHATPARPDHAVVRGRNVTGEPLVIEGRGCFARCLQHETDHLNGLLHVERLPRRERARVLREMAERADGVFARRAERAAALGR